MRAIAISGSSTKIGFNAGVCVELCKNFNYDIFTGISGGAIICLLLPLGEFDILQKSIFETDIHDFFSIPPLTNNDKITFKGLIRILTGKNSIGKYNIKTLLKKYYTPELHIKMMNSGKIVIVGATNYNTKKIEYCDITKVDYDTCLDWVVASTSIPLACEPILINRNYYFDGGVVEHVSGLKAIDLGGLSLDVVFSRPKNRDLEIDNWKPNNILKIGDRTFDILSRDVTYQDEDKILLRCEAEKIPVNIIYAPYVLTNSMYEMTKELSIKWWNLGVNEVKTKFNL